MKYLLLFPLLLMITAATAFEETEGMRFMRLGCEKQKLGLGCTNYANFLLKNGRESEADAYFEKGCKFGHQDGCDKKRWESNVVLIKESPVIEETDSEATVSEDVESEATVEETVENVEAVSETTVDETTESVEAVSEATVSEPEKNLPITPESLPSRVSIMGAPDASRAAVKPKPEVQTMPPRITAPLPDRAPTEAIDLNAKPSAVPEELPDDFEEVEAVETK